MPHMNQPQGHYFACVIYPNECEEHAKVLQYCLDNFKCVYIAHEAEEEEKKDHVHLLFDTHSRYTVNGIIRFFAGWLSHVELLNNPDAYLRYMVHNTPDCIMQGKKQYPLDALKGDSKLIKRIVQNSHFAQLESLMDDVESGMSCWEHLKSLQAQGVDSSAIFAYVEGNSNFVFNLIRDHRNVTSTRK